MTVKEPKEWPILWALIHISLSIRIPISRCEHNKKRDKMKVEKVSFFLFPKSWKTRTQNLRVRKLMVCYSKTEKALALYYTCIYVKQEGKNHKTIEQE
jgi:hypothetical protein